MYPITVLKFLEDGSTQLVTIDMSDVLYICFEGSRLVYHTEDDCYYQVTSLQDLEQHLKGLSFEKLDRPYLVNMNKIKKFDKNRRVVYFTGQPDKTSKYVTVASLKVHLVKAYMQ